MSRAAEIRRFAERFNERLDPTLIEQALNYIQYNEEALAFEILCEHLFEYEVPISAEECSIAEALAIEMSIKSNAVKRFRELVK